jgi:DNA uptake protein ComE-like DNA-binding protein
MGNNNNNNDSDQIDDLEFNGVRFFTIEDANKARVLYVDQFLKSGKKINEGLKDEFEKIFNNDASVKDIGAKFGCAISLGCISVFFPPFWPGILAFFVIGLVGVTIEESKKKKALKNWLEIQQRKIIEPVAKTTQSATINTQDTDCGNSVCSPEYVSVSRESSSVTDQEATKQQTKVYDVNTASYNDLLSLPGIGAAEAKLLLNYRGAGRFPYSITELVELLNLKPHIGNRLEGLVFFSKLKAVPEAASSLPVSEPSISQPKPILGGRTID